MTISLEQFKNQTLGGSYGNPGSGTYFGECVSYVRQYMEQVQGIPTAVWGHAANYWYNPAVLANYDRITNGSRQDGDILVWGDDAGNWTGPPGHIGISYGGKILNQNFGGSRKVTIDPFFSPGYLGALRRKNNGGQDMPIPNADNYYWRYNKAMQYIRGRSMSREEFNQNFVGRTDLQMLEAMLDNPEADAHVDYANWGRTAKNDNWAGQIAALQAQVADLGKRPSAAQIADIQAKADELAASSEQAKKDADEAVKVAAEATAKANELQERADADKAAGDSFLRRIGQLISQYLPGNK